MKEREPDQPLMANKATGWHQIISFYSYLKVVKYTGLLRLFEELVVGQAKSADSALLNSIIHKQR